MQEDSPTEYHKWYYERQLWAQTKFLGVPCLKSVCDLWNYQEILFELRPGLIVEFGAYNGGSALFLSAMVRLVRPDALVFSVDVDLSIVAPRARTEPSILFMQSSSSDPQVAEKILDLRSSKPGPIFCIVDSDHRMPHVRAELELLREVTRGGDYVVVEDSNINGHPVLPDFGPGPWEAVEGYMAEHPNDYFQDEKRAGKFGWTFAPHGYLVRR